MIADVLLALTLLAARGESAVILSSAPCVVGPATTSDGTPRFWTSDRHCYSSAWFSGRHRIMIGFGCTSAPYYAPVDACGGRGFHHGIDIDMPVGTAVYSGVTGRVVLGTLGGAYGPHAVLIRTATRDYVLGHVGRLYVTDGQQVQRGQLVARSNRLGAPDGPHLHLEMRPRGGTYRSAMDPRALLRR